MKSVLITGGTGGLGTVVAERLCRDYNCILLKREDVGDPAGAVARAGSFYGLVHLVGGFASGSLSDTPPDAWHQMIESNVTAAFNVIRAVLPKIERPGRIVAISSITSIERFKGAAAYIV